MARVKVNLKKVSRVSTPKQQFKSSKDFYGVGTSLGVKSPKSNTLVKTRGNIRSQALQLLTPENIQKLRKAVGYKDIIQTDLKGWWNNVKWKRNPSQRLKARFKQVERLKENPMKSEFGGQLYNQIVFAKTPNGYQGLNAIKKVLASLKRLRILAKTRAETWEGMNDIRRRIKR